MIYPFGRGVGLGAEMVGLIKTAIRCLDQRIQLQISTPVRPEGFAVRFGWRDYFEPLFPERSSALLSRLNRSYFPAQARLPLLPLLARWTLRVSTRAEHFVFSDLGPLPGRVQVPELGIDLSYPEACRTLLELCWRPVEEARERIGSDLSGLELGEPYHAAHVRRGDKAREYALVSLSAYRDAIARHAGAVRRVFVASDDPSVPGDLENLLGAGWTVVSPRSQGPSSHDQGTFNSRSTDARWRDTVRFLADVEALRRSSAFFGSTTSNVGILLRMFRADRDCVEVA